MKSNKRMSLSLVKDEIQVSEMIEIQAGKSDAVTDFCIGAGAVSAVYGLGVALNWWNPIGWGGTVAMAIVGAGCGIYALVN